MLSIAAVVKTFLRVLEDIQYFLLHTMLLDCWQYVLTFQEVCHMKYIIRGYEMCQLNLFSLFQHGL